MANCRYYPRVATLGGNEPTSQGVAMHNRLRSRALLGTAAITVSLIAPLAALLLQLGISRQREYQADASGVKMVGHANGLISALEKLGAYNKRIPMDVPPTTSALMIVQPLSARQMFSSLFSTHPPLADRIAALRNMTITREG